MIKFLFYFNYSKDFSLLNNFIFQKISYPISQNNNKKAKKLQKNT